MTNPINNEELRKAIETAEHYFANEGGTYEHAIPSGTLRQLIDAAKRLLDEGEKCAVLQSQVDNADVMLQQQKLCTASLRQQLVAERAIAERLRAQLADPPLDVQELVVTKLGLRDQQSQLLALTTANQRLREALQRVWDDDEMGWLTDGKIDECVKCTGSGPTGNTFAIQHEPHCLQGVIHAALSQTPEATGTTSVTPMEAIVSDGIHSEHAAKMTNKELGDALINSSVYRTLKLGTWEVNLVEEVISRLKAEATDEGKDKERLDWLEANADQIPRCTWFNVNLGRLFNFVVGMELGNCAKTLRGAIDAAMDSKTEGKQ